MSDKMQCPMTFTRRSYNVEGDRCKEHECAWWVGDKCAVAMLAIELDSFANVIFKETIDVRVK